MDCSPPSSSVQGDFTGNNTGVGCHALLQGIFPTQGSNPGLPPCRCILYRLSYQESPRLKCIFINQNRNHYNKFVHFCRAYKSVLQLLMNSWKAFSASCWLWKCFPCKMLLICLKNSRLVRGQVNMGDEAKLHRPIPSTSEALVVWHVRIGPFLLTTASCRCSFQCISLICWAGFSDVMVLLVMGLVVDQIGSRPPVTMTFF